MRRVANSELSLSLDDFRKKFVSYKDVNSLTADYDMAYEIGSITPAAYIVYKNNHEILPAKSTIVAHSKSKNQWHIFYGSPCICVRDYNVNLYDLFSKAVKKEAEINEEGRKQIDKIKADMKDFDEAKIKAAVEKETENIQAKINASEVVTKFHFMVTTQLFNCTVVLDREVKIFNMTNSNEMDSLELDSAMSKIEFLLNAVRSQCKIVDKIIYCEAVNGDGEILSKETSLRLCCSGPQYQCTYLRKGKINMEDYWISTKLSVYIWWSNQ